MTVYQPIDKQDWLDIVNPWLIAQNERALVEDDVPWQGLYLVGDVAAGCLVTTDTNIAFIEALVTNPAKPAAERSVALDAVTSKILRDASVRGFARVIAITTNQGLCARAVERHGFTYAGQKHGLIREL